MRRYAFGCLAWILALVIGQARADERRLSAESPSAADESYAWAGFYAGVDAGYAFGSGKYTLNPALAGLLPLTGANIFDLFGSRGASFGILGGYNLPIAQYWLVGLEGDWSRQRLETQLVTAPNTGFDTDIVVKQPWAFSLRGRFGYFVTPATLFYGTAGWGWSKVDYFDSDIAFGQFDSSVHVHGFQGGAGIETAVTPHFHMRLEYLQTLYDTASYGAASPIFSEIKPQVGTARFATIYQFGAAAPASEFRREALATAEPRWTGLYVGGALGSGVGYANVHFVGIGDLKGAGIAGPVPSLLGGVNYQALQYWVIGAETEIAPSVRSTDLKLGWIEAVRGRLGFLARPDTLIYGSGGWVVTHVDDLIYSQRLIMAGQTIDGAQIGGGVETAFTRSWSARFDYQYAKMHTIDLTVPAHVPVSATVEPRGHVGRLAIIWRFGN